MTKMAKEQELESKVNYILRAMPESHPLNMITDMFRPLSFLVELSNEWLTKVRNEYLDRFAEGFQTNPLCVINKEFMDNYGRDLVSNFTKRVHPRFYSASIEKTNEIIRKYTQYILSEIEIARRIWGKEFRLLEEGEYSILYHEGDDIDPMARFAKEIGIKVILLDKDGIYSNDDAHYMAFNAGVKSEEFYKHQRERERDWMKKIQPNEEINSSLLVTGNHHLNNNYGLLDKLATKNISISLVDIDCKQIKEEVRSKYYK